MKLKDLIPQGILAEEPGDDAIAALRADHDKVDALFTNFDQVKDGRDSAEKRRLVGEVCREFIAHSTVEEEIFYPALRAQIADDDLMNEAKVEHEGARRLVTELESMDADDDMLNAKMHVLCGYIKHHVREEEQDMFPKARHTALDMVELGARIAKRKRQLLKGDGSAPVALNSASREPLSEPRAPH